MDKAKAGQRHIPAKDWNEIRDFINNFSLQNGGMVNNPYNPFLITIKNSVSGVDLEPFQVVRVNSAMYPSRSADDTVTAALNGSIELDASAPTGADGENIAIVQHDIANGDIGSAICSGATLCYVNVANANTDYKFAKSKAGETDYLEADEDSGQARIVWKQPGTGKKLAYVILDKTGVSDCRDYFLIETGISPNNPYKKGALVYISYNSQYGYWVPDGRQRPGCRLAVCQEDCPDDGTALPFKMPYYTPEMNYGLPPNRNTTTHPFTTRCGVVSGEHEFTNKSLDYRYANGKYIYEPIFMTRGLATRKNGSLGIEIEGETYQVYMPEDADSAKNPLLCVPDIYVGDPITVLVNATGTPQVYAIQYPKDALVGTSLVAESGTYLPRGWDSEFIPNTNFMYIFKTKTSQDVII